jgi:hypothetical protein
MHQSGTNLVLMSHVKLLLLFFFGANNEGFPLEAKKAGQREVGFFLEMLTIQTTCAQMVTPLQLSEQLIVSIGSDSSHFALTCH